MHFKYSLRKTFVLPPPQTDYTYLTMSVIEIKRISPSFNALKTKFMQKVLLTVVKFANFLKIC